MPDIMRGERQHSMGRQDEHSTSAGVAVLCATSAALKVYYSPPVGTLSKQPFAEAMLRKLVKSMLENDLDVHPILLAWSYVFRHQILGEFMETDHLTPPKVTRLIRSQLAQAGQYLIFYSTRF